MKRARLLVSLMMVMLLVGGCTNLIKVETGNLIGTVLDAATNEPIVGAIVEVENTSKNVVTGSNGAFKFAGLQPGSYNIKVNKDNYQSKTQTFQVVANADTTANFKLDKVGTAGTIKGVVVISGTTEPVDQVTVKIDGTTLETQTDLMGEFSFPNLSYGTYTLSVSKNLFVSTTKTVELNQDMANVTIEMEEAVVEEPGKTMVRNFKDTMYQMGNIYYNEQSLIVGNLESEMIPFFESAGGGIEEFAFGLENLDVLELAPGKYEYVLIDATDEWGPYTYWDYQLVEAYNPDADPATWEVIDTMDDLDIVITAPNTANYIQINETTMQMDIDLTGATFDIQVTSNYTLGSYTGTLAIGDANVKTFTYTDSYDSDGDGIVEDYITNIIVPSGPTVTVNSVIDANSTDGIDDIVMNGVFNVDTLTQDAIFTFNGSIETTVGDFTGMAELTLTDGSQYTSRLEQVDFTTPLPSMNFVANGQLVTSSFTIGGDFNVDFNYVSALDSLVPYSANMNISYTSTNMEYTGLVTYDFVNYDTVYSSDQYSAYEDIKVGLNGTLNDKVANKTYTIDVLVDRPDAEEQVQADLDFTAPNFTLSGKTVVYLTDGMTFINLTDNNLTEFKFSFDPAINASGDVVGSIVDKDGVKCADVVANMVDYSPVLTIEYTDGTFETIPLDPVQFLPVTQ